ncbi:13397_t:CDS:2, partial [Dentiscutata heterogama]
YKTAYNIVSTIELVLEEFGISGSKLVSITMDNGSNVKAAVAQLSNKISPSKPIVNIFCAAYTLQLKKKCKQLQAAQISTSKKKSETIDVIQDVEIRWNSTYIALKRLIKLERPIRWLVNDLENSSNIEHQHDGSNIRDKMLSNKEFQIIHDLVDLLYPFDKATEILSGSNYATLCIMIPTIEELINHLNQTNSESDIINEVKDTILDNLSSRWSSPHEYGSYTSFLDPRFKNLSFCSSSLQRQTIEELKDQFNELNRQINQATTSNTSSTEQTTKKKSAMK